MPTVSLVRQTAGISTVTFDRPVRLVGAQMAAAYIPDALATFQGRLDLSIGAPAAAISVSESGHLLALEFGNDVGATGMSGVQVGTILNETLNQGESVSLRLSTVTGGFDSFRSAAIVRYENLPIRE